MLQNTNVLTVVVFCVWLSLPGKFAAIQRDVRTSSNGICVAGLLKHLPSSSFSASSVLRNESEFGPQSVVGDLYAVNPSKAWCPDKLVSNLSTEWLQIEFTSTKIIKNIFTAGRNDGNYGEFVTNYYFDYQRENGMTWYRYRDGHQKELIKGNNDARNPTHFSFETPLIAKRIRIIPINMSPKSVCLSIILYGCDFTDGVVEYRIPRGDTLLNGTERLSFDDDRYDGYKYSNQTWLLAGMGKLMDNFIPINSSNQSGMQKPIVAWNRKIQMNPFVEMMFRFDTVRTFRSVILFPAIVQAMGMIPPTSFMVEFYDRESKLMNAKTTSVETVLSEVGKDGSMHVNLDNRVAGFIRMKLFFNGDWMGLSEVVFDSGLATIITVPTDSGKYSYTTSPTIIAVDIPTKMSSKLMIHVTLIACFIGAFILVMILTIICFLWVRQRNRRRYKSKLSDYRTILMNDASYPSNMGNINTISGKSPLMYGQLEPHIFGPNSVSTLGFRYMHPPYATCQENRGNSSNNSADYECMDSYWPRPPPQQSATTILKDNSLSDQLDRAIILVPGPPDLTHSTNLGNENAVTSIYGSGSAYSSHPYDTNISIPDIVPPATITNDTFSDIFNIHIINPLKGLLGTSMSSCMLNPVSPAWIETALSRLSEIVPSNIIVQKHVSEGDIGHITSAVVEDCNVGVILATIKRHNSSVDYQYGFYRQCLLTIKEDFTSHQNLLPLVGRSIIDGICPSIMFAYPSQVNVVTFFHKLRQIPRTNDVSFTCSYVSQSSLLYLMKQLADALAFLDEASVVHRDVAARNCSIGDRFHLILSDFAIGLEEFQDDYTSIYPPQFHSTKDRNSLTRDVQLPLPWMPWEAIIMGNFSSMSDVWSFGVTLWEIFTECQLKPYSTALPVSGVDRAEVLLTNCLLLANGHPSGVLPNGRTIGQSRGSLDSGMPGTGPTSDISKHVRDMMHLCWQPSPAMRPNFQTLYTIIAELSPETRFVDEYGTLHRLIS